MKSGVVKNGKGAWRDHVFVERLWRSVNPMTLGLGRVFRCDLLFERQNNWTRNRIGHAEATAEVSESVAKRVQCLDHIRARLCE
jgi:hypothetical protein